MASDNKASVDTMECKKGRERSPPVTIVEGLTSELLDAPIQVGVHDGENSKTFWIHRALLGFYSSGFKGVCNALSNIPTQSLELRENIAVFQAFVLWLYTRRPVAAGETPTFDLICKLWVFGKRNGIRTLMNAMVSSLKIAVQSGEGLPYHQLRYIYNNTEPKDGLRVLTVFLCSVTGEATDRINSMQQVDWPNEAIADIMTALSERMSSKVGHMTRSQLEKLEICTWHVHEPGFICVKSEGGKRKLQRIPGSEEDDTVSAPKAKRVRRKKLHPWYEDVDSDKTEGAAPALDY